MQISIKQITQNKEEWMPLLLLADPDEGMVKKYLDRGLMLGAFGDGQPCWCYCGCAASGARPVGD